MLTPTGPTISPKRASKDFGENDWGALAAIDNAVVVAPQLFVPRGSDLKVGDKFAHQGQTYFVTDGPKWDTDHAFSGDDFGWVEYEISTEKGPGSAG